MGDAVQGAPSLGKWARRILGKRFHLIGGPYRAIFVDVPKIARHIAAAIPPNGLCLDIGGGDGAVAEHLLRRRSDIRIVLADLADDVGGFVSPRFADRIELRPRTSVKDLMHTPARFDAILVTDVIHHIPVEARPAFFSDLVQLCQSTACRRLIIKDIEPGGWRADLALWSDVHVTGDRRVVQIPSTALQSIVASAFGPTAIASVEMVDRPNYCLDIQLRA